MSRDKEEMNDLIQEIPISEKLFLGRDLNRHVGKDSSEHKRMGGWYGFGEMNYLGTISEFVGICPVIANTYFIKRGVSSYP